MEGNLAASSGAADLGQIQTTLGRFLHGSRLWLRSKRSKREMHAFSVFGIKSGAGRLLVGCRPDSQRLESKFCCCES